MFNTVIVMRSKLNVYVKRKNINFWKRNIHVSVVDRQKKLPRLTCVERSSLILGIHVPDIDPVGEQFTLTKTGQRLDELLGNQLYRSIQVSFPPPRLGEGKIYYNLHEKFASIAVVGLGDECLGYNPKEQIDERKEAIRSAVGLGVQMLKNVNTSKLFVESFSHAESAGEGASLASWIYQDLKAVHNRRPIKKLELFDSCDLTGWKIGLHKAAAQNLTRLLAETPANNLTPSTFAQTTIEMLSKYGINVNVRMQNWAKLRNLHGFLAVSKGSCEPPVLLEILYEGCDPEVDPVVLIGKGVTFDSGGLCLKNCKDMKHSRGDMSGAAMIVATFRAIAALQLPINVVGLLPLCVNVPGASAYKPGDIIRTYNGKTVLVEDTDCETLLLYADILAYAKEYCPKFILDIGTLAPDLVGAFDNEACGVWSNNDELYEMYRIASIHTGDRIWRYPLWYYFRDQMKKPLVADFSNKSPIFIGGGACKSASFLREFIPEDTDWIHIDTYNTNVTDGNQFSYLGKGMSGRSTRNVIEFLAQFSCKPDSNTKKRQC